MQDGVRRLQLSTKPETLTSPPSLAQENITTERLAPCMSHMPQVQRIYGVLIAETW